MNERGFQSKADISSRSWESSEFPSLCETCLGDSSFVRMICDSFGGSCKMCSRPYTIFKWRPGRGQGYKKTEVCQSCSKVKNICQSCILDLQFGLPSQLRDAVLAECDGSNGGSSVVPESDANREYHTQQQLVAISEGNDPWQCRDNPNERLLRMARLAAHNREQPRVKISQQATDEAAAFGGASKKRDFSELFPYEDNTSNDDNKNGAIPLPPGISNENQILEVARPVSAALLKKGIESQLEKKAVVASSVAPLPPKPKGPPPASAFKKSATMIPQTSK